jgi:hypothetical protein
MLKIKPRPQSLEYTEDAEAGPSLHPAAVACRRLTSLLGDGFSVPNPKPAPKVIPVFPAVGIHLQALPTTGVLAGAVPALLPIHGLPTSPNTPASDENDEVPGSSSGFESSDEEN